MVEVNILLAFLHWVWIALHSWPFISDIAIFVLKRDVKHQLTNNNCNRRHCCTCLSVCPSVCLSYAWLLLENRKPSRQQMLSLSCGPFWDSKRSELKVASLWYAGTKCLVTHASYSLGVSWPQCIVTVELILPGGRTEGDWWRFMSVGCQTMLIGRDCWMAAPGQSLPYPTASCY